MKRVWLRAVLLIALALVLVTALWMSPLQRLERSAGLPALYAVRGIRPPPPEVVIVALDAASAQQLGVPARPDLWPRRLHATLVDGLVRSGARAIGFDLLFERPGDPAEDAALSAALARAGNVVLAERVVRNPVRAGNGAVLGSVDRLIRPLPALAEAAWATAPFVLPKTPDGVYEFWAFPGGAGGQASMPVRLHARAALAAPPPGAPADVLGLNLYGPFGTIALITYDAALRLLDGGDATARFGGRLVLVGLAEPNQSLQFDAYRTPYTSADGVDISGVELAATALANLIDGSSLHRLEGAPALVLVLAWSGLLAVLWAVARTSVACVLSAVLVLAYGLFALRSFAVDFVWLPVVFPLLVAPLLVSALAVALKYRQARARHRRLQRLLGIDRDAGPLARLAGGLEARRDGRVVRAVCLCSDIAAYTTLAEGCSPERARDMLNRYLEHFLPIVEAHGGDATDIVGDSIMSLWVVGADTVDACVRALSAARALDACMNGGAREGALPTRFGLHLGEVFFGEVGAGERTEIRPIGDVVNTASRIQNACKPLGLTLLASEAVMAHVADVPACQVGRFRLKGKRDALALLALDPKICQDDVRSRFATALQRFSGGDAAGAQAAFDDILARAPDHGPARFYAGLCAAPHLPEDGLVVLGAH